MFYFYTKCNNNNIIFAYNKVFIKFNKYVTITYYNGFNSNESEFLFINFYNNYFIKLHNTVYKKKHKIFFFELSLTLNYLVRFDFYKSLLKIYLIKILLLKFYFLSNLMCYVKFINRSILLLNVLKKKKKIIVLSNFEKYTYPKLFMFLKIKKLFFFNKMNNLTYNKFYFLLLYYFFNVINLCNKKIKFKNFYNCKLFEFLLKNFISLNLKKTNYKFFLNLMKIRTKLNSKLFFF